MKSSPTTRTALPRSLAGAAALALSALLAPPVAVAADIGPATKAAADRLAEARSEIAAKRWPAALAALKAVNATDSADWNNLMGYVLRKGTPPDLDAAERHYDEALRLDPRHRGALEYSGELHLMRGDLPRAEQRLAVLDKLCFMPCEEYTDLKEAITRFKAGKR